MADLKSLQDHGAAGILVSSLDPSAKAALEQFYIPLMSLLGFGEAVLDQLSRTTLEELRNSLVTLVARKADPYRDVRPELFQPHETAKTAELFTKPESTLIGRTARLLGQPYFGSVGKIVELPQKAERTAAAFEARSRSLSARTKQLFAFPWKTSKY